MFDEGEANWRANAPFRTPVYVLTHVHRAPWPGESGTTVHFVTDRIESALAQAKAAAGGRDVRISGGADTIRQHLEAGLVNEIALRVAPLMLGQGLRLFDGLRPGCTALEQRDIGARRS
jgi:dihydrofolate reductase